MKQGSRDRYLVGTEFGKEPRNLDRVGNVGLAVGALLTVMNQHRQIEGSANGLRVSGGALRERSLPPKAAALAGGWRGCGRGRRAGGRLGAAGAAGARRSGGGRG